MVLRLGFVILVLCAGIAQAQTTFYNSGSRLSIAAGTTLYVNGTLNNAAGTFHSAGILQVAGSARLAGGTYTAIGGTDVVRLSGSLGGDMLDPNGNTLSTLELQTTSGAGATLQSNLTLNKQLLFTNPVILHIPSATTQLTMGVGATPAGYGTNAYVDGALYANFNGPINTTYPIGIGTAYRPLVLIGSVGGLSTVEAAVSLGAFTGTPGTGGANQQIQLGNLAGSLNWSLQLVSGPTPAFTSLGVQFDPTTDLTVASPALARLAIAPTINGNYTAFDNTSATTAGALYSLVGNTSTYPFAAANFLTVGTAVANPGTLGANTGTIVNPGTLSSLSSSVTLPTAGLTDSWLQSTASAGPFTALSTSNNSIATTVWPTLPAPSVAPGYTHFRLQRSLAGDANNQFAPGTSANLDFNFNPYVVINLKAYLQGRFDPTTFPYYTVAPGMNGVLTAYYQSLTPPAGLHTPSQYSIAAGLQPDIVTNQPNAAYTLYPATFAAVPDNALDMVEVELYTSLTAGGNLAATRTPVWLLQDGSAVHFQTGKVGGSNAYPYAYLPASPGSYYVAVHHRNHLSLLSATATVLNTTPNLVDLTQPANVHALQPSVQAGAYLYNYGGGLKAFLFAGNAVDRTGDAHHYVNSLDYSLVSTRQNSPPAFQGYFAEDLNLDGVINAVDFNLAQAADDNLYFTNLP